MLRSQENLSAVAALVLSVCLCSPAVAGSPAFDQGVDVPEVLEEVRRGAEREPIAESVDGAPAVLEEEAGFATGNAFYAVMLYGRASVSCRENGQSDHASFRCGEEVLDPAEFVRFRGPKGLDADRVYLSAAWENGKTREKNAGYDGAKGESTSRFNLWISTLLQRPLLNYGKNSIRYVLKKDEAVVREGTFTAEVKTGFRRDCRYRRHYSSSDLSDCRAGATRVCGRYFRDENYCR